MPLKGETIATAKSPALTFPIEPGRKETLRTAAYREHRSIANMVKVMIRVCCGPGSMTIGEQTTLSSID
jgi:hypothetical protein